MVRVYMEEREGRIRGRRQRRKQARVARTRREVLRYSFLFTLLFVGIAGFIKASWSVSDPDTDIIVAGNDVVSAKQVRQVLRAYLNKPVYTVDPKAAEATVESLPGVNKAFVRRYIFPRPHLVVNVMEEFPWASYAESPEHPVSAVISQTGRFIPVAEFPTVPQPSLVIYGDRTKIHFDSAQVSTWSNWVNFISAQTKVPVAYVDMRKPNGVEVKTGELLLRLGSADSLMTKRLSRLSSILPVLATLKRENIEYVDLSLDSNVPLKISKFSKKEELIKAKDQSTQEAAKPIAQNGSGTL